MQHKSKWKLHLNTDSNAERFSFKITLNMLWFLSFFILNFYKMRPFWLWVKQLHEQWDSFWCSIANSECCEMENRPGKCQSPKIWNKEAIASQKTQAVSKALLVLWGLWYLRSLWYWCSWQVSVYPRHPDMSHLPGTKSRACFFQPAW